MKKNLMYLLLFILVIFAALKGVDALEDTMLVKYIPVPEAYVWKRDTTGHRTTTSQHIYVMARASDHQIVYCIEPGTAIDETHKYTGYENNFATYASMTSEQWERVMLLAYYGYNYHDEVTDHTDVKWYAVAQYMIWKTVPRDYDIYFTPSVYINERLDDKYATEQAEMERLLQNHYKTPQFDSGKLLLGEKVTLSDKNNVLGHYELKTKISTVSKKGNTLEVNASSLGKIEFQMQKTDSIYSHTPIVFVNSETQDVMEVGSYNPISSKYSLEVVAGKVKLLKLDKDSKKCSSKLAGAIYGVYKKDGTLVTKLTINNQCMAESDAILGIGDYYIKEIQAPNGYEMDSQSYPFTMTHENVNQVKEITVYDKEEKGTIKIKKYDAETKTCTPTGASKLKGAVYGIYQNDKLIQKVTIQDNCEGVSSNLPLGNYYIKEIEAPYGYGLDTRKYEFSITSQNYTHVQEFTMYDTPYKGKVKLIKYDSETKTCTPSGLSKLKGAIYGIFQNGTLIQKVTIQDNCEGISTDIPFGDYYIQEIEAPYGYELDTQKYEFSINSENYTHVQELTMYDHPYMGKVKIIKYDSELKTCTPSGVSKLKGAIYGIFQNEKLIQTITIQDNCEGVSMDIPLGDYYIEEMEAPYGYDLDTQKYGLSITSENYTHVQEFTMYDHPHMGSIKLIKYDSESKTCQSFGTSTLAGAIYGIFQKGKLIQKLTIQDHCEIVSSSLPLGDYYIQEMEAPYGYQLDPQKYEFSLTDDNYEQEISITVYDQLKRKKVQIIKRENGTEKRVALANIAFKIYDLIENKYVCETDDCIYYTNDLGEFITKGLPYSKYRLEEVQQPILGYLWNPVPLEFEIDEESSDLIVLSFYNEAVVGGIKIEKRNERGEPLEGIEFEITANEDIYDANHEILYHAGDVVEVLTTNQDGFTSIKGIPLGSYLVKEIKTQEGYLLSETVFEVNLTYQDELTPVVYDTLKVVNYSIPKTKQDSISMLLLIPICLGGYFLYDKKNTRNSISL